jgi:hypothetical protein
MPFGREKNGGMEELKEMIRSIMPTSLIARRQKVWDHLADLYTRTDSKLWIMGEGADLSDEEVMKDFSRLGENTKQILKNKKVKVVRIQTVDTWVRWFEWILELKKEFYSNFQLCFTDERLKFVPQLNLRDEDELVLVPPEESVDVACGIRIFGNNPDAKSAINAASTNFESILEWSVSLSKATHIANLINCLKVIKEIQKELMIACRFQALMKSNEKKFEPEPYRYVQRYFTLDKEIYDKTNWNSFQDKYAEFRSSNCKNLRDLLLIVDHELCWDVNENQPYDQMGLANHIIQKIPDGGQVMDPNLVAAYLGNEHIRGSALRLIEYLSNSFYYIIRLNCK